MVQTIKIKKWSESNEGAIYGLFDEQQCLYTHFSSNDGFAMQDLIYSRPEKIKELDEKYGIDNWIVSTKIESLGG